MSGPHEWFRFKNPTPAEVCAVAHAFRPCTLWEGDFIWPAKEVPRQLYADQYLPPCDFYTLVCDTTGPFLRLNTMDLDTINRVMELLTYPRVSSLELIYKVNKS